MTELSPLGSAVTVEKVASLMTARSPELLDPDGDGEAGGGGGEPSAPPSPLFVESVWGVCAEVQPLAGDEPGAGPDNPEELTSDQRWDLAIWAVTLGVAAQLEASLFPEQQGPGGSGRAAILERRYQGVLAQLRGRLPGDAPDEGGEGRPPAPRGNFPPAPCYPDPAIPGRPRGQSSGGGW